MLRRAAASVASESQAWWLSKVIYPLARELAADSVLVAVMCRVLEIARQPYYRWLAEPYSAVGWERAHRLNALIDAHGDDPEFVYRLPRDEAEDGGWPGQLAFDNYVRCRFTTDGLNLLWLTDDISEYRTGEGELYLCAVKDVFSNRIVGYSISDRMGARLIIDALEHAVARRGVVAGCIVHADRGQPVSLPEVGSRAAPPRHGRLRGP